MKQFKNKIVVITGGAAGMGQAIAKQVAGYGATVVIADVNDVGGKATAQQIEATGGRAAFYSLDVSNKQAFDELLDSVVSQFGALDYLFNNAGIAIVGEVRDQSEEDWQRVIEINQMGVLFGTLAAYKIMLAQGGGCIVNTASIAGLISTPLLTPYCMTKHAVIGLTMGLRDEAKAYGIQVNAVCPGIIRTSIADGDFARGADFPDPFIFLEQRLKIKAISADQAATFILQGVNRNQAQIIFPAHGKAMVRAYDLFGAVTSRFTQTLLKIYRRDFRKHD